MDAKHKSARIVPASRSANNILASVFGARRCDAWSENERERSSQSHAQDGDLSEPFIRKDSESDTSVDSERLCVESNARIFAIDFEKNVPKDKRDKKESRDDDSHSDAKVVDKFVRTNKQLKTRKNAKSALVKLCRCCPWTVPWSMLIVSAIQILTYTLNNDSLYRLMIFSPVRQFEIWRFVTYTFLHAGAVHLILNVIIQTMVSFPLETEQGHGNVLLVYFAGVLAGGLGASVFEPTLMVGASAGVYCLLMSHIPHIVMNFQSLSYRYFRIVAVLVLCISDVIYSIRHCLTKGNLQPRIGVAAHVSGATCGLLFGFIVYQGGKLVYFRIARYAGLLLYLGWIVATVFYNMERRF
ncbi:rhomboid-related protein 2 [Toxorhynchites rutilus septentrionalis]|uniref:rhomboid-related protein 2 n=1 Tax=Toxorhynchites rutilus septentrionalis TaxID=329112 RepID=UPI00247A0384|nr:rhomboid-related protein 2 [Toxorhynchites rutilus septentrionalis]XP_055641037.1 rhomboid-related protein 2 [Toxorhynchites rutilus septentrionalis]